MVIKSRTKCTEKLKKLSINYNKNNQDGITGILSTKKYDYILKESQLVFWIEKLKKAALFSLSTKSNHCSGISASLSGLSFSIEPNIAAYIPMMHSCMDSPNQISLEHALKLLKPILEDSKILKVGQNIKFDHCILQNYGIELRGITFDTMLESYVLDSTIKCQDIESLADRWLNKHDTLDLEKINHKEKHQLQVEKSPDLQSALYTAKNADIALQLHLKIWPKLQEEKKLLNIFKYIEMPLVPVLSRIERNGVKIDLSALYKHSKDITLRLLELKNQAYSIVGQSFNLFSTKALQRILFETQNIKPLIKTPSGSFSTSKKVLEKLAFDYPLPKVILEYRGLAQLKSNYTDKLPLMINPETGRVHTLYRQAITSTGRLSSTNPNLQNIPVRNQEGRRIRQTFIAPEDYLIVSADYSQIELRVMAHLSRDKNLLLAFANGHDVHCVTAAEIFDLPVSKITNEQRYIAKIVNFSLIYGLSAFGLSCQLNITQKKSQEYIDLYFKRYSGILEYIERIRTQARKKGYVETLYGRRLYLPEINSNNIMRRTKAERAAVNATIQGTAADIIKSSMITIDKWLRKDHPRVRMIMQVHDELVFEVHRDDIENASNIIHEIMENEIMLDAPLLIKVGKGKNLDQAH